jgi:hypothetical protein
VSDSAPRTVLACEQGKRASTSAATWHLIAVAESTDVSLDWLVAGHRRFQPRSDRHLVKVNGGVILRLDSGNDPHVKGNSGCQFSVSPGGRFPVSLDKTGSRVPSAYPRLLT